MFLSSFIINIAFVYNFTFVWHNFIAIAFLALGFITFILYLVLLVKDAGKV